ncbi:multi-drug resistance efflux pump pmrA [Planococcus antarcticus DSM 14505]|uniref:MFS transporter n=1 Tax=Planococcus antarcticus DSM 14505 TaxID=1185653 RepID=A0A1C7DBM8_9BACL|nr:MFS transporter [Planococcus antarcticus]ANU08896.1 MFS transporter [Planococcus antarcticus DSM 14505]EIM06431.1 multi-drug resistance efflux pump pmrA [Planococcus antarcticus DSM 14505]
MRLFIYVVIFFAFFDLFAQLPIMSTYAVSLGASPFIAGLAVGMYSLSNTFGNVISGIFSDRKGPFAILVIGLLSTSITLFTYTAVDGPYILLVVRFLHGLAAGLTVPAAFTYLANRTEAAKRGKGAALSGAFVGLAAILGPAYGAVYTSRNDVPATMSLTGTMILLIGIAAFWVLRKTSIKKEKTVKSSISVMDIVKNSGLIRSFSGAFFLMFSQGVLAYMLPFKVERLGLDPQLTGLLLSTFGISAILVFLLPINRIFDAAKPIYTLIAGFTVMGASLFFLSAATTELSLYASMCSYGLGFALLFPSINSILIDSTNTSSRGRSYGYFYAFFSIGVVAGSSITGALALSPNQGFIVSGLLLLAASLLNILTSRK